MIGDFMGGDVHLVDSGKGDGAGRRGCAGRPRAAGTAKTCGGTAKYFVSDTPDNFDELAHTFLGEYAYGTVERIRD